MKTKIGFSLIGLLFLMVINASAQRYRTAADTPKLNIAYVKLSNEIADLTSKLTIAKNDLPAISNKNDKAELQAERAAENSSNQAQQATNGKLRDAKRAKKDARNAYQDAQRSEKSASNLKKQERTIAKLSAKLADKEERLQELHNTRETFRTQKGTVNDTNN